MKMSEYAAQHANDGQTVEVKTFVKASALVGEEIIIDDMCYIEKTKFDNPSYLIKMADGTGFFATSSITRQLDKFIKGGVTIEELIGCKFRVVSKHLDEGEGKRACDFLQLEFVEDTKEE